MKKLLLAVLFLASATAFADMPKAGDKAPAFTLQTAEGKTASLADFKGHWVVLYFYPKDFTGGCTLEAHNFQRDLAEYQKRDAVILGVSVDSADSHAQFCSKEALKFTLLSDAKGEVSQQYGSVMTYNGATLAARNTFLIDPQGNIAQVFTGVKPATHSEEVLAALDQLRKK